MNQRSWAVVRKIDAVRVDIGVGNGGGYIETTGIDGKSSNVGLYDRHTWGLPYSLAIAREEQLSLLCNILRITTGTGTTTFRVLLRTGYRIRNTSLPSALKFSQKHIFIFKSGISLPEYLSSLLPFYKKLCFKGNRICRVVGISDRSFT